jgi:hypothetical protein
VRASHGVWVGVTLLLTGCTGLPFWPATEHPGMVQKGAPILEKPGLADTSLTPSQVATYMAEVPKLSAVALNAEIRRLQAGVQGNAGNRLKLAYLLGRQGAAPKDLARARGLLAGLPNTFEDPGTRAIARLLERTVKLEQDLSQERRKALESQAKIEQLMSLERDLQKHSSGKPEPGR